MLKLNYRLYWAICVFSLHFSCLWNVLNGWILFIAIKVGNMGLWDFQIKTPGFFFAQLLLVASDFSETSQKQAYSTPNSESLGQM